MTVDKQGKYLIFNLDSGKFSVVNNKVVQARGVYNRPITTEEREVIYLWEDRA